MLPTPCSTAAWMSFSLQPHRRTDLWCASQYSKMRCGSLVVFYVPELEVTYTHTHTMHSHKSPPTTHHKHGQEVAMFSDFHVFAVSGYLGDSTQNYFFVQVREGPHFHCFTTFLLNGTNHTSLLNGKLKHHQCTSQHVWANAQLHVYQPDHHDAALSMYFPLTTPLPVSHSPLNSFPATGMPSHSPTLDQVSFAVKLTHPCFCHTQSRSVPTTFTSVSLTDMQAMTAYSNFQFLAWHSASQCRKACNFIRISTLLPKLQFWTNYIYSISHAPRPIWFFEWGWVRG